MQYLRQLVESATGEIEPLPDLRDLIRTAVSSKRIKRLFDEVSALGWKVNTPEQYEMIVELAKQMTLAKHIQSVGRRLPNFPPDDLDLIAAVADQKFAAMKKVAWNASALASLNEFALDQLSNTGEGVVVYCTAIRNVREQNAVLTKINGTEQLVILKGASHLGALKQGWHGLVLGFVLPPRATVRNHTRTVDQWSEMLLTHYVLLIR